MLNSIRNIYFAATAQQQRINDTSRGHSLWVLLYLVMIFGLLDAGRWEMIFMPASAALLALLIQNLRLHQVNYRKLIIVSFGAPLPSIVAESLDAPPVIVMLLIFLAGRTIGSALFEQPQSVEIADSVQDGAEHDAESIRRLRSSRLSILVEMGPPIGQFQSVEFPGWFRDHQGRTHEFVAAWTGRNPPMLEEDESLLFPGLIYKMKSPSL